MTTITKMTSGEMKHLIQRFFNVAICVLFVGFQSSELNAAAVLVLGDDFYVIGVAANSAPVNPPVDPPSDVWGATIVSNSSRPERSWISSFGDVSVTGISSGSALQTAINNCADYCVIEIDQLPLTGTININKSKVKLMGKSGNKVTFTGDDSIFSVGSNTREIIFEGLVIDGQDRARNSASVFGIFVDGHSISKVQIKGNTIKNLYSESDAHGIAIYGTGNTEFNSVSDIIIENNTLDDLRTGSSESIVVNGNVKQWEILNNNVSNVNNIAIDAIGGEGTSATRTVEGRVLPGLFDAAREGFIEGNSVTNMSTIGNTQYDGNSWAAAIYVDGGRDISISGNSAINTPWGHEIGAENCIETSNITLSNNSANGSYFGDLVMGGYTAEGYLENTQINCNPLSSSDSAEGHGYVSNATVKSNSFSSSRVDVNKVELQLRIRRTVIIEPGIIAVNTDGVVSGDQNSIRATQ
ncbi:MAG: hypothetical protein JKX81_15525 [Arenicella sp.]|nr:hypothetical protein [Arenicella sp.]